jgi:pantetheine-phosphate adenylyltransferase
MKTAIYAFSGDPITNGHIDIIERALNLFDHVVVGIGLNPKKKYDFSLPAREIMAKNVLKKFGDRITVKPFEGLLVDFAFQNNIKILIRGIRTVTDFDMEQEMFYVNLSQRGIEVIPLFAKKELRNISSSTVKELQRNQGDVTKYVPLYIKQCLEITLSNQYIIGITGEIGAGKTYIANILCELMTKKYNIPCFNLELDKIGKNLLTTDKSPFASEMRKQLILSFDLDLVQENTNAEDCFINVKKISSYMFQDPKLLKIYNDITKEPIVFEARRQMLNKTGLFFLNSALLVEGELTPICNNNVILIHAPEELKISRLKKRGYSEIELKGRMNSQLSHDQKEKKLCSLTKDNWGTILIIHNDQHVNDGYLWDYCSHIMKIIKLDWKS